MNFERPHLRHGWTEQRHVVFQGAILPGFEIHRRAVRGCQLNLPLRGSAVRKLMIEYREIEDWGAPERSNCSIVLWLGLSFVAISAVACVIALLQVALLQGQIPGVTAFWWYLKVVPAVFLPGLLLTCFGLVLRKRRSRSVKPAETEGSRCTEEITRWRMRWHN